MRAPYLHHGAVPTLRDLLEPPANRPKVFWRGYDLYDQKNVGFIAHGPEAERVGTKFDTSALANGNGGHVFGTTLPAAEKESLLEYLMLVKRGISGVRRAAASPCLPLSAHNAPGS